MQNGSECRIIAMGGPKGGVGRTTAAVALARALVSRDHSVLLVDFSPYGLGISPEVEFSRANARDMQDGVPEASGYEPVRALYDVPVPTSIPHLDVMTLFPCPNDLGAVCGRWRQMGYDDVILDLRAGFDPTSVELFLHADLPVLMATPEPDDLVLATFWLRHVIAEHLRRALPAEPLRDFRIDDVHTWRFDDLYARFSPEAQKAFADALSRFRCAFLLNRRRENSECLQSRALCHAWGMTLGVHVAYLGSLACDERRWFYQRRLADVTPFVREDPLVREWDDLMREQWDPQELSPRDCLPLVQPHRSPRQFLGVTTIHAARVAYRQLWEGYRRQNGFVTLVMPPDEIARVIGLLEVAWRRSEFDEAELAPSEAVRASLPSVSRELSNTLAAVRHYDRSACQHDAGTFLTQQRQTHGLTLGQLATRTRIPQKTLERLESLDIQNIPPARLQAYLFELAKVLELDLALLKRKFGL